jgi:hypothetical protein
MDMVAMNMDPALVKYASASPTAVYQSCEMKFIS